jgi:Rrf2 family protein
MKRNSRLSLALHTLSHMACDPGHVRTSADIAAHAGTNPVVRRVLGKLRQAGLLSSEKGHAGGWRLTKPATEISLADVYLALDERFVSGNMEQTEPSQCHIETGLHERVADMLEEIEDSLVRRLRETSIADVHPKGCSHCESETV